MERLRIAVREADEGSRLDALVATVADVPRSRAAQLVADGCVTVDGRGRPKAYRVSEGELVEVEIAPEVTRTEAPAVPPVVFEDDDLLVVAKPAGLVVHRAAGVRGGTLVDALESSGRTLARRAGADRPGIVHRLDKDVSGLLVVAKSDDAHAALVDAMKRREIVREYLAAVSGAPDVERGKIEAPIGRHPRHRTRMAVLPDGKPAVTWFRVVERMGRATLLEVRLETGRTHQIRTHLASIGLPIVGDAAYGHDHRLARELRLERPFLHAFRLSFTHPVTGARVSCDRPLPAELEGALDALRGS